MTQLSTGRLDFLVSKGGIENLLPARFTRGLKSGKIAHHHSSQPAGTYLIVADYKVQEWEAIAGHTLRNGYKIKARFFKLTVGTPRTEVRAFGLPGLSIWLSRKLYKKRK